MIDSSFIIKYTNALYSTAPEDAPRYDEFRDMFSSGQIYSKEWVIRELARIDPIHQGKSFIVAGAWYGTLGMMIKWRFPGANVAMLDIDPRCGRFIQNMIYDNKSLTSITDDMYRYSYHEDVIINTSCEHISNVQEWLAILPKDRTVVLQSNNYLAGNGHINCVSSIEEFIKQTGLQNIIYSGELVLPIYTRYMIIGKT